MDIYSLDQDIVRYLQRESLKPESESKDSYEAMVSRVVETVFTKVFKKVFEGLTSEVIQKRISIIPNERRLEIFPTCLSVKTEESSASVVIQIAKICAQNDRAATAFYIKNFGITNQAALVEIAKLCAEGGILTARNIQNFGITNPADLVEIAKLCAQNNGGPTAANIQKFGIEKQAARIEIAKLCAQNNGGETAANIQNFGIIEDQAALVEIAKLCAQNNGGETAANIQNFDIKDQVALIEIAKLCAQNNGRGTAANIQKFDIHDSETIVKKVVLFEIGVSCLIHTPEAFRTKLDTISPFFGAPPSEPLSHILMYDFVFSRQLIQWFSSWEFVSSYASIDVNKEILRILCFYCTTLKKLDVLRSDIIKEFVHAVLDFKVPILKTFLFELLLRIISDNKCEGFDAFIKSFKRLEEPEKKYLAYIFMLTVFGMQNLDDHLKTRLVNDFLANIESRKIPLAVHSKTGSLIEFVRILNDKVKERRGETYGEFITYDKGSAQFSQNLFLVQAANAFGINITGMKSDEVRALVSQQVQLPEGFDKIFENLRCRESLYIYVGVIRSSGLEEEEQVLETLKTYLEEVTNGTFHERRYERSPHLKKMKELYCQHDANEWKTLIEAWKMGQEPGILQGEFTGYTIENTDNHWDLFLCGTEVAGSCQRVDGDAQFNKHLLGYVVDGKIRMIAVKDSDGRIVARSIIKLLWEEKEKKPVLLMEKIYSNVSALNPIVEEMAKKEAKRLCIAFVTKETAGGRQFQSYTNRSGGLEYEDSEEVVQAMELEEGILD